MTHQRPFFARTHLWAALGVGLFLCGSLPAQANDFHYHRSVTLKVGESDVIYGIRRSDCGDTAPAWDSVQARLPHSSLGAFSDGGEGTVRSKRCDAIVGARGIRFTGQKTGSETITLFGDPVKITVQ